MDWIETLIVAIVEGLTEFLPVSSTGHMIIVQNLLGVPQGDPFVHAFTFIIQFGAILSVVCLYWKNFFQFECVGKIAFETGNKRDFAANNAEILAKAADLGKKL